MSNKKRYVRLDRSDYDNYSTSDSAVLLSEKQRAVIASLFMFATERELWDVMSNSGWDITDNDVSDILSRLYDDSGVVSGMRYELIRDVVLPLGVPIDETITINTQYDYYAIRYSITMDSSRELFCQINGITASDYRVSLEGFYNYANRNYGVIGRTSGRSLLYDTNDINECLIEDASRTGKRNHIIKGLSFFSIAQGVGSAYYGTSMQAYKLPITSIRIYTDSGNVFVGSKLLVYGVVMK